MNQKRLVKAATSTIQPDTTRRVIVVTKPYFDPVQIGDEIFDLSHLNPFTLNAESVAAKKNLRVRVIFSDH